MKTVLRFLFELLAPVLTLVTGAGIAAWGDSMGQSMITYVGIAVFVIGIFWCLLAYGGLFNS